MLPTLTEWSERGYSGRLSLFVCMSSYQSQTELKQWLTLRQHPEVAAVGLYGQR